MRKKLSLLCSLVLLVLMLSVIVAPTEANAVSVAACPYCGVLAVDMTGAADACTFICPYGSHAFGATHSHGVNCSYCGKTLCNKNIPATCTTGAKCSDCGATSSDPLNHLPGDEATCTDDQICTREGCGKVLVKGGHVPGAEATCTTDQICTREGCGTVLVPAAWPRTASRSIPA